MPELYLRFDVMLRTVWMPIDQSKCIPGWRGSFIRYNGMLAAHVATRGTLCFTFSRLRFHTFTS